MFAQQLKTGGMATSAIALAAVGSSAVAQESFEGAYLGLSAPVWGGGTNGDNGSADYDISNTNTGVGVVLGYNILAGQNKDWVVGAEVAFDTSTYQSDDYELHTGFSAKLKVGRAVGSGSGTFGSMLVYGFASYGVYDFGFADGDTYSGVRGPGVGIGVEANMTDSVAVGLELHHQSMKHNKYGYNYGTASPTTLSFRTIARF